MNLKNGQSISVTVDGRKISYHYDDIRWNPKFGGIFVTRDGKAFLAEHGPNLIDFDKEITPRVSSKGYAFIDISDIPNASPRDLISETDPMGKPLTGEFLHRLVVFSFGDKDGRPFVKHGKGWRSVIDHVNMNKMNASVENLQLVSDGINRFRAYYKTKNETCKSIFKELYDELDPIDKMILDNEIALDLAGKY